MLKRPNDETLQIYLNDNLIGEYCHDEIGWSGLNQIENLIKEISKTMNWEIEVE